MKIAVAYEDGNVHPHFGQCTCVKIYEVENNAVVSTDVVDMSVSYTTSPSPRDRG